MAHPTRLFLTPQDLLNAWEAFKEDLKDQANEWQRVSYVGKDGNRVSDPVKVPYTFEGFKRYCRSHHGDVEHYFYNKDELYTDFVGVCSRIKEEIRENQIIGGLLGFHNPSITQRLNSLVEKTDSNVSNQTTIKVVDPKGKLNNLLDQIENE